MAARNLPENKEKAGKDGKFETTFQPKKSAVNFGTLKHETPKPPKKKKKGKLFRRLLLILLILVLLLAGTVAALYFTGYLRPALEMLGLVSPPEEMEMTLEQRKAYLDILEVSLKDREEALNKREKRLAQWEQELAEAAQRQASMTFRERMEELSEEEIEDLKRVGLIYTNMSAEQAAKALAEMHSLNEAAMILYYMRPASAAQVLEQMEAKLAADLTGMIVS